MAIVPLLVSMARELEPEYRSFGDLEHCLDDDFGYGIHPMDIFRPRHGHSMLVHPRRRNLPYDRSLSLARRAARLASRGSGDADALVHSVGKDGFQVCMDVSQFKPNELVVKTVDKTVVIEGKHDERQDDHGLIQRHFIRKYTLPKDYDANDVVSTISSDGVLTVKAPPPSNKATNERVVQITHTGPAHLSVKAPEDVGSEGAAKTNNCEKKKIPATTK